MKGDGALREHSPKSSLHHSIHPLNPPISFPPITPSPTHLSLLTPMKEGRRRRQLKDSNNVTVKSFYPPIEPSILLYNTSLRVLLVVVAYARVHDERVE